MIDQEYFKIAKEYKIPLTGEYNALVYECKYCRHDICAELYDHIIGFAESNFGLMKVMECPKCFEKYYCHCGIDEYHRFLREIARGKQRHFDKVYK